MCSCSSLLLNDDILKPALGVLLCTFWCQGNNNFFIHFLWPLLDSTDRFTFHFFVTQDARNCWIFCIMLCHFRTCSRSFKSSELKTKHTFSSFMIDFFSTCLNYFYIHCSFFFLLIDQEIMCVHLFCFLLHFFSSFDKRPFFLLLVLWSVFYANSLFCY